MKETLAHCNESPHDKNEHEGTWEICHGDDWGHGAGSWNGEEWIPVRIVVSRWKTINIPLSDNWVEFSGGSPNKGLRYFREPCSNHYVNPRRLHQEEMNLSSVYRGREGEILMHDPVILSSAEWRIDRLDQIIQGFTPSLPIIHVVVNGDDYPVGSSGFDVFIKDRRLNPTLHLSRYGQNLGTFNSLSPTAGRERYRSANSVAACGDCAAEGEVTIMINNTNMNMNNPLSINSLGHRGYGRPISASTLRTWLLTDYVIFSTPDRRRLRIPVSIVLDILKQSRWKCPKIYPQL